MTFLRSRLPDIAVVVLVGILLLSSLRARSSSPAVSAVEFVAAQLVDPWALLYCIIPAAYAASAQMARRWNRPEVVLRWGTRLRLVRQILVHGAGLAVALVLCRLVSAASVSLGLPWRVAGSWSETSVTLLQLDGPGALGGPLAALAGALVHQWLGIVVFSVTIQALSLYVSALAASGVAVGLWLALLVNFRVVFPVAGLNLIELVVYPRAMEMWGPLVGVPLLLPVVAWWLWAWVADRGWLRQLRWTPVTVYCAAAGLTVTGMALHSKGQPAGEAWVGSWFGTSPDGWNTLSYLAWSVILVGYAVAVGTRLEEQWTSSLAPLAVRHGALWRWWWRMLFPWLVWAPLVIVAAMLGWSVVHVWVAGPTAWSVDGWPVDVGVVQAVGNGILQLWGAVLAVGFARWVWGGAAGTAVAAGLLVVLGVPGLWWIPSHLNDVGMAATWGELGRNTVVLVAALAAVIIAASVSLRSRRLLERNMQ